MKWPIEHWPDQPPYVIGQYIESDLPEVDPYTYEPTGRKQRFRVVQVRDDGYELEIVKASKYSVKMPSRHRRDHT